MAGFLNVFRAISMISSSLVFIFATEEQPGQISKNRGLTTVSPSGIQRKPWSVPGFAVLVKSPGGDNVTGHEVAAKLRMGPARQVQAQAELADTAYPRAVF
jgi:hypothetical protein